ncbi:MAG: hypothetical protein QMD09_10135 [Desulfatibacillaceae bacterium]|nr:hypothetical protein [Desulfatibacillaceae bacterium]
MKQGKRTFSGKRVRTVLRCACVLAVCLFAASCSFMGYTASSVDFSERPVAQLANYDGTVVVKTHNAWGNPPMRGMDLYSGDKVLVLDGSAGIRFADGSKIGLCRNSFVQITQEFQRWAPFRTARNLDRAAILYLGRLYFDLDKASARTHLSTPSMVFTMLSGKGNMAATPSQESFILLESAPSVFKVGEYKFGAGPVWTDAQANSSKLVQAVMEAEIAANQAAGAEEQYAAGSISAAQRAYSAAQARWTEANERLVSSSLLVTYHPEREVLAWAKRQQNAAQKDVDRALEDKNQAQKALDALEKAAQEQAAEEAARQELPQEEVLEMLLPESR